MRPLCFPRHGQASDNRGANRPAPSGGWRIQAAERPATDSAGRGKGLLMVVAEHVADRPGSFPFVP